MGRPEVVQLAARLELPARKLSYFDVVQLESPAKAAPAAPPGKTLSALLARPEAVVVEAADKSGPTPEERIAELNERFEGVDDPIMLQIKATIENRLSLMRLDL